MGISFDGIDLLFVLLKGNASVNFAVFGMKMCNDKNFLKFGMNYTDLRCSPRHLAQLHFAHNGPK